MEIMTKKLKYCIIIMLIVIIFAINIYGAGPGDGVETNSWKVTTSHIGSIADFWCSWIYIHFGQGIDAKIKAGEGAGSGIIYVDKTEGKSNDVEAYGYGLYQFDLKKHMVGYLYYLREKLDDNGQTDIAKTPEEYFAETGNYVDPPNLNFKDACKYVADKLMCTAYSKDTVDNYLNKLLQYIERHIDEHYINDIKRLQSDYWYRVYAQRAYGVLTGSLGFSTAGADMQKVQGALLSIMEDRYRDKNLKNKPRMQLSVEKGDLWPFLVYTETNDNGATTQWQVTKDDNKGYKEVKKTDWKQMLTGAYQYMVYYEYKVDDEADSVLDKRNTYNGVKAEMFREEYHTLFNENLPELSGKDLDDFYQRIRRIRRYYKKSSDNGGGVFGEEELYDISSDITYSNAINKLSAKINGEFKDVFKGLDSDYIARTYLMAKNIADTTRLIEQNAQYDIGSNIVSRTPGGYNNQVLLSDLQLITLNRDDNGRYTEDADGDGLTDGRELGNEDGPTTPLKISGFIKKMLKAEAGDSYSEDMYNMYKANIQAAATAADNAENRGNIVTEGRDKEKFIQTQHDIRVVGDDIYVDVMAYTSNPILKDTDFDGVWDGHGKEDEVHKNQQKDTKPLDNNIRGDMVSSNRHFSKSIYFNSHMDYRYFFMEPYNYYDELSTMSLLLSNAMNKKGRELSDIDYVMPKIGYDNYVRRNAYGNVGGINVAGIDIGGVDYNVEYITGLKVIEYSKDNTASNYLSKIIVPVIIKTPDNISLSNSYSEIGEPKWTEKCDVGRERHSIKSYEIYAELIKNDLSKYSSEATGIDINAKNIVFWITGHKEAGAIANVLASKYIDEGHIVYAYTFGSPMTLYNNSDEEGYTRNGYNARYDSIFNVVNEEDAYTYIMPQMTGFSRYGMTCYASGREILTGNIVYGTYLGLPSDTKEIREALEAIFRGNEKETRTYLYGNNKYLSNYFQKLYKAILNFRITASSSEFNALLDEYKNNPKLFRLINLSKQNCVSQHGASTTDVYYYLAKNMQNADITNVVNVHDNKKKKDESNQFTNAIETVGDWYIQHVYTYQGAHKYKSEIETMAQSAHPEAKAIWDARKASLSDTEFVMKSTNDETNDSGEYKNNDAIYDCSLFDELNYIKTEVVDDCSKFATAVYYYYYNQIGQETIANEFDLKYTGSARYSQLTNYITEKLERNNRFKVYTWKMIQEEDLKANENNAKKFELQAGDLLYRKEKKDTNGTTLKSGHVEFYLGNNKVFGWGRIHDTFDVDKTFTKGTDGFYSDDSLDCYNEESQPYVTVIRYNGVANNE